MTSLKKINKIIEKIGGNPFNCSPEKVAWKNYRYSSHQRECGALAGEFYNVETGKKLYASDSNLGELLSSDLFIEEANGWGDFEDLISVRNRHNNRTICKTKKSQIGSLRGKTRN